MKEKTAGSGFAPLLIGHRGASLEYPENTIPAFARALELGADMLELDVRLSKEGQVVVIHDATVNRTTSGSGKVKSFTVAQLKKLTLKLPRNSGTKKSAHPAQIATLDEVFQTFPQATIAVEIKDKSWTLCLKVVELIKQYDRIDRTSVELIAIDSKLAAALRKLEPRVTQGHTTGEIVRFAALSNLHATRLFKPNGTVFEVPLKKGPMKIVTRAFVRAAHKKGIRVFVWTVNDANVMANLLTMGVDGIFTDNLVMAKTVSEHLRLLGKCGGASL